MPRTCDCRHNSCSVPFRSGWCLVFAICSSVELTLKAWQKETDLHRVIIWIYISKVCNGDNSADCTCQLYSFGVWANQIESKFRKKSLRIRFTNFACRLITCWHITTRKSYRHVILHIVLWGCEDWSVEWREGRGLRVLENRVLRRILGNDRGEWKGTVPLVPLCFC
jgi:hypothetical protein